MVRVRLILRMTLVFSADFMQLLLIAMLMSNSMKRTSEWDEVNFHLVEVITISLVHGSVKVVT